MLLSRYSKNSLSLLCKLTEYSRSCSTTSNVKPEEEPDKAGTTNAKKKATPRLDELQKKLRAKTPIGKLDEYEEGKHPFQEKEPLKKWPNSKNPETGEVGGPAGPEPTRYGDWERKGRVSDF